MITESEFATAYAAGFLCTVKFLGKAFGMNAEDARENAQAAWAKAWESRAQFAGENGCTIKTWVQVIARNMILTAKRKELARELHYGSAHKPSRVPAYDVAIDIDSALSHIEPRKAEAIQLRYYQGLGEHEMSSELHISTGCVKTRIHRGIAELAKQLA